MALALADAVYESLLKVIAWMLYGLPFGLCCLFADQVRRIGLDLFSSMFKMMVLVNFSAVLLAVFYSIVIWWRSETTYMKALSSMRRAMMVALGTSSSFAAIPFALEGLNKRLRFESETVNLMIPLGITLNPHGNILCFAMTGVFMAQLYQMPLGFAQLGIILFLSVMSGVAASSAPGMASLSMIALVLNPLGLPSVVGIILLAAMNPVIDPLLTLVNLYGNCATASLVADKESGPRHTVQFATVSIPVVDQP